MKHEINVPVGCKVVSVETTDEMVVVKFEKEEPEFKENDIVYTVYNNYPFVSILNNCNCDDSIIDTQCSFDIDENKIIPFCNLYTYDTIRLATDSEKQLLFDKLKEKCLMFDGKDIVRWRARNGEKYYLVFYADRIDDNEEEFDYIDNGMYKVGNYFPTHEIAESFQKQYIDLLNNFHKNL